MGRIIAVTNQKGGVGKTTTCVNLAAALAANGRRVLVVDLDPQGNATVGSGLDRRAVDPTAYEVLTEQCSAREAIQTLAEAGFDALPATGDLTAAEVELLEADRREQRLHNQLRQVADGYDYLFIDCPPALNILTLNALAAAHGTLIPVQCEYLALEGLAALLDTIRGVQASANPDLVIEGLVRTMYDARNNLAGQVGEQLAAHFGGQLYEAVIPRNVRLAEAPSHGLPALAYDRASRGALAYVALASEMERRQRSGGAASAASA